MKTIVFAFALALAACATTNQAAVAPQVRTTAPGQYFYIEYSPQKSPEYFHLYLAPDHRTIYRCPRSKKCFEQLEIANRWEGERCVDYTRCAPVEQSSNLYKTFVLPVNCLVELETHTDKLCGQEGGTCVRARKWNEHARRECFERNTFDPPSDSPADACGTSCF